MQFTLDSIEAVTQSLKDENQIVRMKASWSLGNISDSLVLNRWVYLPKWFILLSDSCKGHVGSYLNETFVLDLKDVRRFLA